MIDGYFFCVRIHILIAQILFNKNSSRLRETKLTLARDTRITQFFFLARSFIKIRHISRPPAVCTASLRSSLKQRQKLSYFSATKIRIHDGGEVIIIDVRASEIERTYTV